MSFSVGLVCSLSAASVNVSGQDSLTSELLPKAAAQSFQNKNKLGTFQGVFVPVGWVLAFCGSLMVIFVTPSFEDAEYLGSFCTRGWVGLLAM